MTRLWGRTVRPRLSVVGVVVSALVIGLFVVPQPVTAAPFTAMAPLSDRRVAFGWIPWWDIADGVTSVQDHSRLFSDVAIFWYTATPGGNVISVAEDPHDISELTNAITTLHGSGVRVLPTVEDLGLDSASMGRLLSDASRRRKLITSIVETITAVGADGVDIDFEHMNFPSSKWRGVIARKFPVFLASLRGALRKDGLTLSLAVPARTGAKDPNWSIYDYRALRPVVDRVRLMTYDYHYAGGDPGPLAPRSWVDQVARYASKSFGRVPISVGQITSGLNWYVRREAGRCPALDPPITDTAVPTVEQARTLAKQWRANITWDKTSGEYHFRYHRVYQASGKKCTVLREVWFEDARSVANKLEIIAQRHLQGLAFWTLGTEDPKTWKALSSYATKQHPAEARASITAPPSMIKGDPYTVDGRFAVAGEPIAEGVVHVLRRLPGKPWREVTTLTTSSSGRISYPTAASRTYEWRLRLNAAWDWATTSTMIKRVEVINARRTIYPPLHGQH